jgi:hypothetical protein
MLRRPWILALAVAAFFFFWLIPSLSKLVSMAFSFMVLDPTIKFSWSVVHHGFLAFLRISIKFSYCLDAILSFLSR